MKGAIKTAAKGTAQALDMPMEAVAEEADMRAMNPHEAAKQQEQAAEVAETDEERAKRVAAQWIREESTDAPAEQHPVRGNSCCLLLCCKINLTSLGARITSCSRDAQFHGIQLQLNCWAVATLRVVQILSGMIRQNWRYVYHLRKSGFGRRLRRQLKMMLLWTILLRRSRLMRDTRS